MKKAFLTSFIVASISLGCSSDQTSQTKAQQNENTAHDAKVVIDPQLQQWVGQYSGTFPCAACVARCPECEGMGVDLTINPDQSFKLIRESYSGHNEPEVFEGKFKFLDDDKLEIQLIGINDRNILFLGNGFTEVLETQSLQPYSSYQDFQLKKTA